MQLRTEYGYVSKIRIEPVAPHIDCYLVIKDFIDFSKKIWVDNPDLEISFNINQIEITINNKSTLEMISRDWELARFEIISNKIGPLPADILPRIQAAAISNLAIKSTDASKIIEWLDKGGKTPVLKT